ncbi:peptidoglycan D,D-transpeptidase FtsI family protein [Clostridium fallax]|uniref:Penicillin-binding protein 2 n=1 Tax=Clostridium fallax TaxID=1533 RepID=A0A1M4VAZ1_9CLOT|nr:penicillin-binding transpeptidase domain-containing protein [Clostridium fallax]SHE66119.1 penicillin-binding protein 2 [Clostridium fallax]SQB05806.1 penicillin-binding protein dimerisation domain-contain protein [Clostridium fallax]
MKNTTKKKKPINRYSVLIGIMFGIFSVILLRLLYLQVYKYNDYKDKANTAARRFLAEKAPRGKIYDSSDNLLATNKQTYNITFTETDKSTKDFFTTMEKVFSQLDDRGEKQIDDFKLKVDEDGKVYFDFGNVDDETKKALEIRFKRDRGLNDSIRKKLFKGKEGDLTDDEESQINEELLKITPDETFNYLIKLYGLYGLLNPTKDEIKQLKEEDSSEIAKKVEEKYSKQDIRRYMVVKDAIKIQSFSGFKPITVAANINQDTAFIFLQKLNDMPGINVVLEPMRYYPYGNLASSVLGYVSSINSDKKDRYEEKGYDVSTDKIGVAGIEAAFERILKGAKGGTTVKVNSSGRKTEELFKLEPAPGENVHLSIDKNIQYSAEQMLKHQLEFLQTGRAAEDVDTRNATRGAAVAIEVKTGRILSMVSYPDFDPNVFSTPGALTPDTMKEYFNTDIEQKGEAFIKARGLKTSIDTVFPKDKNGNREDRYDVLPKPMYNYATMGLFPPGSTFKPMTAVAALSEGVVTPNEVIPEKYYFNEHPEVFGKTFAPQDNKDHGANIDIRKAIAVSCNHYFYETGYRMYMKNGRNIGALDSIAHYAWKAGLGVDPNSDAKPSTGIEIAENFGQTYNFQSFKKQNIYYAKYELVDSLEKGAIDSYIFAPLDIAYNEDDSEPIKKAKQNLKDIVNDRLNQIGNSDFKNGSSDFNKKTKAAIEELQKVSPKYQKSIADFEAKGKKNSVKTVVFALEQFISNKDGAITTPAELVYDSIGQGTNNFTLVQLANYIATVVNGGTRYKAHLVDKITNSEGETVEEFKPEILDKIDMSESTVNAIREGMEMTNSVDVGTAASVFRGFPIRTGGKTGTATFREDQKTFGREAFGVYVSAAPINDPEIAVAVVIYDGGHGYLGAPVARAIYETYYRDKLKTENPNYKPTFMDGGTYTFSLNPPLDDVKDDGVHLSEQKQLEKTKLEEKQKAEEEKKKAEEEKKAAKVK